MKFPIQNDTYNQWNDNGDCISFRQYQKFDVSTSSATISKEDLKHINDCKHFLNSFITYA